MTAPRVVQDDVREQRGLVGPRRCHQQQVLFQRHLQPVPVLRPAERDRVLARVAHPLAGRQRRADAGGLAPGRIPAPAQPQLEHGRDAPAGVQPQVQPDPRVPDPVPGQAPAGDERPLGERGHGEDHCEDDDDLHDGLLSRAASTAVRSAVRAAPVSRPTSGASSVQVRLTFSTGKSASGPWRSATRARNRDVLDSARRPAGPRLPMIALPAAGATAGFPAPRKRRAGKQPAPQPGGGARQGQRQAQRVEHDPPGRQPRGPLVLAVHVPPGHRHHAVGHHGEKHWRHDVGQHRLRRCVVRGGEVHDRAGPRARHDQHPLHPGRLACLRQPEREQAEDRHADVQCQRLDPARGRLVLGVEHVPVLRVQRHREQPGTEEEQQRGGGGDQGAARLAAGSPWPGAGDPRPVLAADGARERAGALAGGVAGSVSRYGVDHGANSVSSLSGRWPVSLPPSRGTGPAVLTWGWLRSGHLLSAFVPARRGCMARCGRSWLGSPPRRAASCRRSRG